MSRLLPALVLLLVSPLLTSPLLAADPAPRIRCEQRQSGNTITYTAINETLCPVVMRVYLTQAENVDVGVDEPVFRVIHGGESKNMLTVHQSEPGKRWHVNYKWHFRFGDPKAVHDDSARYALPFDSETPRLVGQGNNGKFTHFGDEAYAFDFRMPTGTPILAARGGTVVYVRDYYSKGGKDESLKDKANMVLIQHEDGTIARYLHLRQGGARVAEGQQVKKGEVLGESGAVGYATNEHLHFDVLTAGADETTHPIEVHFEDGSAEGYIPLQGKKYPLGKASLKARHEAEEPEERESERE